MKAAVVVMVAVVGLAGAAQADGPSLPPINITPNQAAGDDTNETTIDVAVTDDHSSEANTETTIDNSSEVNTDNSIGELHSDVRVGEGLKHRAAGAADSRAASIPLDHPCGDSTGLSAQTGIAGGSLSTVSEACRAFRVEEYGRRSSSRARKFAVETAYWLGFPTRLALAIVTGGALN